MAVDQNDKAARDALTFMLAPEGKFFREFMLEEIVRGIDALTRNQLAELVHSVGLGGTSIPILFPGALRPYPLAPAVSEEDRLVIKNTARLLDFLAGNQNQNGAPGFSAESARLLRSLLPLLPDVTQQILPEVTARLTSRVASRFIRDVFIDESVSRPARQLGA
mmetsp:Transcript_9480/g.16300  ORF Transcript_9480/g.16300 Transcript_9480/m.16300 type:complete len:164 (-) Transcript_9480:286-777(-)